MKSLLEFLNEAKNIKVTTSRTPMFKDGTPEHIIMAKPNGAKDLHKGDMYYAVLRARQGADNATISSEMHDTSTDQVKELHRRARRRGWHVPYTQEKYEPIEMHKDMRDAMRKVKQQGTIMTNGDAYERFSPLADSPIGRRQFDRHYTEIFKDKNPVR